MAEEARWLSLNQRLSESTQLLRKDRDTWLAYGYPATVSTFISSVLTALEKGLVLSEQRVQQIADVLNAPEIEALGETVIDLTESMIGILQMIALLQKELASAAPPPPKADEPGVSNLSSEIANTLVFIDGLISELVRVKAIQPNLQRWYAYFRSEVVAMQMPRAGVFQTLMQELQEAMQRVLFRQSKPSPRIQANLTLLWTQLIYLYNQVTVLAKLAQTEGQPQVPFEEGREGAPSPPPPSGGNGGPPPPPPSGGEGGGPPPPPPPSGGGGPPSPSVQPQKALSFAEQLEQQRQGGLKKVPKPAEEGVKKTQATEKGSITDILATAFKGKQRARAQGDEPTMSEEEEEEWNAPPGGPQAPPDLTESGTGGYQAKVSLKEQLRIHITRRMEEQLIGHPLFSVQSSATPTTINTPLIIQLRMPANKN